MRNHQCSRVQPKSLAGLSLPPAIPVGHRISGPDMKLYAAWWPGRDFGLFSLFSLLSLLSTQIEAQPTGASTAGHAPELRVADRFLLSIPKEGFGKDYLFSASLIPQAQAATSTGLAARIVRFELFPDGVDMYESTQGLVVTEDLPARRLLATFAIVRQDANAVVIDFNKGMRRVFTQSWTDAS